MNGCEYDETLWITPSEKLEKFMSAKHSTARGDAEVNDDNTEHEWVEEMPKHTRAHQAKHDDDRLTTMMTRHPVFRRDRKRKNRRRNARPRNARSKAAAKLARDRSLTSTATGLVQAPRPRDAQLRSIDVRRTIETPK